MHIALNTNYNNLKPSYLFSEIGKRVRAYQATNPDKSVIRLGIGDVTLPLTASVIAAMHTAVDEMASAKTFRGYPPEYGYDFMREAIALYYKREIGATISADEVFVSDGAKSDCGNIVDILGDNEVLIPDPVYPVYLDSNIMSGRRVTFLPSGQSDGFLPSPDGVAKRAYVIYICSPNNPTGAAYDKKGLAAWVEFALKTGSLIIYDSAYEAYVADDSPRSIFTIEGARECAIEICSLSKTAGFTGTRLSWTVVPKEAKVGDTTLHALWSRRQATKFNGVPYIIQRGGEAALSEVGVKESRGLVAYYMENAKIIAALMDSAGIFYTGGKNSPYIWLKCPNGMDSWSFFDMLLHKVQVVGTPGAGFGACGEGFFRLTSFGSHENTRAAVERLRGIL